MCFYIIQTYKALIKFDNSFSFLSFSRKFEMYFYLKAHCQWTTSGLRTSKSMLSSSSNFEVPINTPLPTTCSPSLHRYEVTVTQDSQRHNVFRLWNWHIACMSNRDNQPTFGRLRSLSLHRLKAYRSPLCLVPSDISELSLQKVHKDLISEGLPPKPLRNPGCRVWTEQKWKLSSRTAFALNVQPFDLCAWYFWGRCKHPNLNTRSMPTTLQTWREQNPWGIYSSYIPLLFNSLSPCKMGIG